MQFDDGTWGKLAEEKLRCLENMQKCRNVMLRQAFSMARDCIECAFMDVVECDRSFDSRDQMCVGQGDLVALARKALLPTFGDNRYLLSFMSQRMYDEPCYWEDGRPLLGWEDFDVIVNLAEECVYFAERQVLIKEYESPSEAEEYWIQIFSVNLRRYRVKAHMSQKELANAVGFARKANIADLEAGVSRTSYPKVCMLAKILRVTPDELLGGVEEWPRRK